MSKSTQINDVYPDFTFFSLHHLTCLLLVPISTWYHLLPSYAIKVPVNFKSVFCLVTHIKAILMIFIHRRFLKSIPSPWLLALLENRTCIYSPYFIFHSLGYNSQALKHNIQDLPWAELSLGLPLRTYLPLHLVIYQEIQQNLTCYTAAWPCLHSIHSLLCQEYSSPFLLSPIHA